MPGTEEKPNTWRHRVRDPGMFDEFRTKDVGKGVSFVFGKYKGKPGWAMQSIVFDKEEFKTQEEVTKWISEHKIDEKASAPVEDVKMATDYDLVLTYEEAVDKPCLIGLARYVPELEARGFNPDEGRQLLIQLAVDPDVELKKWYDENKGKIDEAVSKFGDKK
jgi:hypothetical protein